MTEAGVAYLVVILVGMPAYFLFAWISAAFRAAGDAATALGCWPWRQSSTSCSTRC